MHRSKLPLTVWFWAAHLMATHSNGMSALQFEAQLGITYKTAWLLAQKLRRSMIDPRREPLEGVIEVDQAEIPFRADNSFFDPDKSGKILIAGAVEVIDRATNQAKPRGKRAKYLDTRSGRIRLAAIPDNSAASIEAFVRANVKPGTTLLAKPLPCRRAPGPRPCQAHSGGTDRRRPKPAGYAEDDYPFRSLHTYLHRCFDAFGPERMFWGTDITRMPCSWRQCVTLFTEELPWLKDRDLELVMGEALCNWIGWPLPAGAGS